MKACALGFPTILLVAATSALAAEPVTPLVTDAPVVLELFTSEGCSSCPPADALLGRLAQRRDLLPLAFHIDYWDYLGWKDLFDSPLATERQYAYGKALDAMVYTPQMVVDGAREAVGSDEAAVALAIDAEKVRPKLKLAVTRDGAGLYSVALPAGEASAGPASVYVALFDHLHETPIGRGENSGRKLSEFNIVRQWRKIGTWAGEAAVFPLDLSASSEAFDACAILVQDGSNGRLRGATAFALRQPGG